MGQNMKSGICRSFLVCAVAAATQLVNLTPAASATLNLICRRGSEPGWLAYWIDSARGAITYANGNDNTGVDTRTAQTYRLQTTPEAYYFTTSMGPVSINRMTGLNAWPAPQSPFMCAKGSRPPPAAKF
jgi:hypothetical protein